MNVGVKNEQGLATANELVFEVLKTGPEVSSQSEGHYHQCRRPSKCLQGKFTAQFCMFGFRNNANETNLPMYSDCNSEYIGLSLIT